MKRTRMSLQQGGNGGGGGGGAAAGGGQSGGQGLFLDHHHNSGPQRAGSDRGGSLRKLGGVGMLLRHADDLGIAEEQQDRLEDLKADYEIEKVDLRAAMRKAKIRLRKAIHDDAPEATVMQLIDAVSAAEGELRKMRYRHLKGAHAVLSQDQRSSLKGFGRRQELKKIQRHRDGQRQSA